VFSRRRPDVVHVHLPRDLFPVIIARWLSRHDFRLVLTAHVGNRVTKQDPFHHFIYRRIDKVVAISRLIRRNLLATCPVSPGQLSLVHPGIDTDRFRSRVVKRLPGKPVIGIVSRISRGKGQDILLDAISRLSGDYPQLSCYMVGGWERADHGYRDELRMMIRQQGMARQVVLMGHRQDLPKLLSAMDYFVFPSTNEAFGLSLVEAMAAGLPCVATRYDGILDIVNDGKDGLLFRRGDAKDLAKKLRSLLQNKRLSRRLSGAARKRVEQHFSLAGMAEQYAAIYSGICKQSRGKEKQ
jgi:glycosyltransferase involved in cell wall biosynthesis